MQPLSRRTRLSYLLLFVGLFCICLPLAILYASGYRFGKNGLIVETGGIYISVAGSGVTLSLNGKEVGVSSLFTHTFYVDNLAPGTYAVHLSREGYYPWYKTLVVEPRIVTDARGFVINSEPTFLKLVRADTVGTSTALASTTRAVSRTTYDAYLRAFAPTTTPKSLAGQASLLPKPVDISGGEELYLENGVARVSWTRSTSTLPSAFCEAPSLCDREVVVTHTKEQVAHAALYLGGVLYQLPKSGIFLSEIDVRPTSVVVPLYQKPGGDFRLIDGALIVKDGSTLYQVTGL